MKLKLRDARLAFPNLWVPYKESFGGRFIIPPNHKQVPELKAAMKAVAKEKWPEKWQSIYAALEKQDKLCLHDGATKAEYEGFEGNLFVAANSKVRPTILDQMRNELSQADGKPYSGCFVVALLELWAQDHKEHGKRINASLRGVQYLRDGDAFSGGGKPADADEFDDVSDTGEEADAEVDIES
jgi:hypothetical protein